METSSFGSDEYDVLTPKIDRLAKEARSFRKLMLRRLSVASCGSMGGS